jgi:phosphoserine phosphatase
MSKKKPVIAIAYDFDGTLAPGNMQEHSFIPSLDITKEKFWQEVKKYARTHDMDEILAYMYLMVRKAKEKDHSIKKKEFRDHGKKIIFYDGVHEWFDRINAYANSHSIKVEHYIISSGLRELVEGSDIKAKFKHIFASGFMYDADEIAIWPALAVNYTYKTQFLFRINKGIMDSFDNEKINKFVKEDERPVPFTNMIYIGDGETDVPCMKMVRYQQGHAIAVYDPKKRKSKNRRSGKEIAESLIKDGRADFATSADYSEGSSLDKLVKGLIDKIAANEKVKEFR